MGMHARSIGHAALQSCLCCECGLSASCQKVKSAAVLAYEETGTTWLLTMHAGRLAGLPGLSWQV